MKRLFTRLSILSGVAALALIAMAYAQWGSPTASHQTPATAAPGLSSPPPGQADPWAQGAPSGDPFATGARPQKPVLETSPANSFNAQRSADSSNSGVRVRQVNLQTPRSDEKNNGGSGGGGASGATADPFANFPPPANNDQRQPSGQSRGNSPPDSLPQNKLGPAASGASPSPANPLRDTRTAPNAFTGNGPSSSNPGGLNAQEAGLNQLTSNARGKPPGEFPPLGAGREGLGRPLPAAAGAVGGASPPGGPQFEGTQKPTLIIQKFAPPEIQVNKPCTFEIHVRNTGATAARDVEVYDRVPQGAQFIGAVPPAEQSPQGELLWRIDNLPPGDERVIKLQLRPLARGEIGSVATVRFSADASARSKCTSPELHVELAAARQTLIGDSTPLAIKITNLGDGPATGVIVKEQVPDKFEHAQGQVLENDLGTLKPQESRELRLTLRAVKPGQAINRLTAVADGEVRVEKELPLEVIAPALALGVVGPEQRILEREAVYQITLQNPGTAPAKVVQLTAYVPPGFKFLAANNYGAFDPKTRRVAWELVELPPGQTDRVELKLLPIEAGLQELVVEARAQRNVQGNHKYGVNVDGVVNLQYQVDQPPTKSGALEVGGEAVYEIRVANNGSKPATNVVVAVLFPPGLQALGGKGPTSPTGSGDRVVFAPLPKLAPRADTTFQVAARAQTLGDHRVKFQISAAELQAPVTKDVSTPVQ